jgi:hypothetical protein
MATVIKKHPLDQPCFDDIMAEYDPAKNVTKNVLSIYEKTALLSTRMEQLANGAPSYIDISQRPDISALRGSSMLRKIAEEELKTHRLPMMICRKLPNGKKEYWRLDDLILI